MPKLMTKSRVFWPMLNALVATTPGWPASPPRRASLQAREIGQVEALQPLVHRWRQGSHRLLQVGGEVQFAGLDPLVDARAFLHQRTGDEDHRDDHDQHADQQGDPARRGSSDPSGAPAGGVAPGRR